MGRVVANSLAIGLALDLPILSIFPCSTHTENTSRLGDQNDASRGSEHVHHGAPSFLSWRGIVFDKAHSVVPSGTRMTHGVEGLATQSSADTHTLLLHTSSTDQIYSSLSLSLNFNISSTYSQFTLLFLFQ